jgi:hypothetical protein
MTPIHMVLSFSSWPGQTFFCSPTVSTTAVAEIVASLRNDSKTDERDRPLGEASSSSSPSPPNWSTGQEGSMEMSPTVSLLT